jgi:hypothetical protein
MVSSLLPYSLLPEIHEHAGEEATHGKIIDGLQKKDRIK